MRHIEINTILQLQNNRRKHVPPSRIERLSPLNQQPFNYVASATVFTKQRPVCEYCESIIKIMFSLNSTTLRVVTRLNNHYKYDVEVEEVFEHDDELGNFSSYKLVGGFAASLVKELSELMNFKIELVTDPPDLTYKFAVGNNLSVDLYAASYSFREDRLELVSPTFVTGSSRVRVFMNRAFEASMQDVLIAPFQPSVWVVLIAVCILVSTAFCFIAKIADRIRLTSAIFHITSIFLHKDTETKVKTFPSRFTQLTASLTAFLIVSAYSAKVVSIGAVKISSINSLTELASSIFDVSFDIGYGNGSVVQYFAEALDGNSAMSRILQKTRSSKFRYDSFTESILEVQRRPFAYIIDEETGFSSAEQALGRIPCELDSISFAGVKYPWTMLLRRGSQYRQAINYGTLRLGEVGIMNILAQRWVPGRSRSEACSSGEGSEFSRIQLTQLWSVFIVLCGGAVIAFILLVAEMWMHRKTVYYMHNEVTFRPTVLK